MQYKLLASDYDNTLVPFGEHFPRPTVVKAVKKMQAAGGKFVLSTGRAWSAVNRKGQLGGIRFDYAITCNGACVLDREGRIIAEHPLTNEEMYALVDFCEDYNYPLQFDFKDGYYAYCEYDYLKACYDHMNAPGLECIDGEDQDRHLIDMPHAAFAVLPSAALEKFNKKYGHLNLHWMQVGGEMPGGSFGLWGAVGHAAGEACCFQHPDVVGRVACRHGVVQREAHPGAQVGQAYALVDAAPHDVKRVPAAGHLAAHLHPVQVQVAVLFVELLQRGRGQHAGRRRGGRRLCQRHRDAESSRPLLLHGQRHPRGQSCRQAGHRGCAGGRPGRPHRGAVVRRPQSRAIG